MWHVINVQLVAGVGNENLRLPFTHVLDAVAVPTQAAINSGVTKVVLSHLLPIPQENPPTILTLTTVTTPYFNTVRRVAVDQANASVGASSAFCVQTINVSITGGVGSNIAQVLILTLEP